MRVDEAHWLKVEEEGLPPVYKIPSVRTTQLEEPLPLGIVWHWTGGPCLSINYAMNLAQSIRTYDKTKDSAASWHVLVGKSGSLLQSVSFAQGSWHVGRPGRIGGPPVKVDGKWDTQGRLYANVNRVTVGVELENAGRLNKVGTKFYCWPYWLNPDAAPGKHEPDPHLEIPAERAIQVGSEWFDDFPKAQQDAATRLLQALVLKYKWARDVSQYGHLFFDPTRREDPGPLWLETYLPKILNSVFGNKAS